MVLVFGFLIRGFIHSRRRSYYLFFITCSYYLAQNWRSCHEVPSGTVTQLS